MKAPQAWLWAALVLQLLDDNKVQGKSDRVEGLPKGRNTSEGSGGGSFVRSVERLVNYLYSKHLEENASPLFSPQVVVMGEGHQPMLGVRSGVTIDLESLEVQLSVPSVWKGLSDKGQHLACWYARENWLRLAAWRVAVAKHVTWRQQKRALNWK